MMLELTELLCLNELTLYLYEASFFISGHTLCDFFFFSSLFSIKVKTADFPNGLLIVRGRMLLFGVLALRKLLVSFQVELISQAFSKRQANPKYFARTSRFNAVPDT
jgi:hypothetical protein